MSTHAGNTQKYALHCIHEVHFYVDMKDSSVSGEFDAGRMPCFYLSVQFLGTLNSEILDVYGINITSPQRLGNILLKL